MSGKPSNNNNYKTASEELEEKSKHFLERVEEINNNFNLKRNEKITEFKELCKEFDSLLSKSEFGNTIFHLLAYVDLEKMYPDYAVEYVKERNQIVNIPQKDLGHKMKLQELRQEQTFMIRYGRIFENKTDIYDQVRIFVNILIDKMPEKFVSKNAEGKTPAQIANESGKSQKLCSMFNSDKEQEQTKQTTAISHGIIDIEFPKPKAKKPSTSKNNNSFNQDASKDDEDRKKAKETNKDKKFQPKGKLSSSYNMPGRGHGQGDKNRGPDKPNRSGRGGGRGF